MTLGLKYKLVTRHHLISDVYAERAHQFLTGTHASVPNAHARFEGPYQIWNFYAYAGHMHKKLMRMLRLHVSS